MQADVRTVDFDTFVVNLRQHATRLSLLTTALSRQGVPFSRVDAVDTTREPYSRLKEYVSEGRWRRSIRRGNEKGAVGCILSHRKAMLAAANGTRRYALVLEDDVVPPEDFRHTLTTLISTLRNVSFDVLLLGARKPIHFYNAWNGEPYRFCRQHPQSSYGPCVHLQRIQSLPNWEVAHVRPATYRSGAWAYLLDTHRIQNVLEVYTPPFEFRNDQTRFYGKADKQLRLYEVHPLLVPWKATLSFLGNRNFGPSSTEIG